MQISAFYGFKLWPPSIDMIGLLSVWFMSAVTLNIGLLPGVQQWQIGFAKISTLLESENCTYSSTTKNFKILLSVPFHFSITLNFSLSLSLFLFYLYIFLLCHFLRAWLWFLLFNTIYLIHWNCIIILHCLCLQMILFENVYTGCFMTLGHNCRRWFPRSLWSKSSYKHVSDFGRLRSFDRLKLRIDGNDYWQ